MKNKRKFIKSLALVALIPTFAFTLMASKPDPEGGFCEGSASAGSSGASTYISYTPDTRTTSSCDSYATIGNSLGWARDSDAGSYYSSASISDDDMDPLGGAAQASRAVSTHGSVVYEDYWS